MKNSTKFGLYFYMIVSTGISFSQSFEETTFPEITTTPSASRSANFIDVNGDGWDDIFFTNGPSGGQNNMLYINNADGTFTTILADDIVLDNDRSDGASFADADNDGDLDAFVVTYGFGGVGKKNYFYRNNGDGSFIYEPTIAMGIPLTYSEMATWMDGNNDQFLDLYFTNSNVSLANMYFENLGDGSFQQVANLPITAENLPSRSIDWIDYDGDGDSDLFVTNEDNENNSLFRNDGPNSFTQITNLSITQNGRTSAGSSWGDIDNDGDFDLFVANWDGQNNQLFTNNGGVFTEETTSVIAAGGGSSFGSCFGDMDNDGDLDLFVCNAYFSGQTQNFVYINDGNGNFTQDTSSALAQHSGYTFGSAFGDYDNDGWLDIILANTLNENQANSLYHNTGTGNNWVKILCKGNPSNNSAVGAKLRVRSTINSNEVWQTRQVAASAGYCSQNSYNNHFGLGNATVIDEIEVSWPSGAVETFTNLELNKNYIVEEGNGIFLGSNDIKPVDIFSIHPNPTKREIVITSMSEITSANIYSVQGKRLLQHTFQNQSKTIDVSSLSAGMYILEVSTAQGKSAQRFIKE